ncbi:hypothetical protein RDWZM_000665 [Blomia tropicalis]|uniref:Mid1-interacting protein n=1 Tax=Blomia tropicalis TaxID=40697 RepID=A0A9Q0MA94_BLOTA|nr:hypothetical protein RDWZM_000665 [Blomia tropicalis]
MLPMISPDKCTTANVTANLMDRTNTTRRLARSEWYTCSQQSILSAMDRFVKSVNNMDATVLVPSRLRDMETVPLKSSNQSAINGIPSTLTNTDLHSFYLMLNNVKKELLWGPGSMPSTSHGYAMRGTNIAIDRANSIVSSRPIKHSRECSDDSLGSLGSTASSTASDTDSDIDSMLTDRDSIDDHTSHLSVAFSHHLQGLHSILHQLADSADYLSTRYQEEVDSCL